MNHLEIVYERDIHKSYMKIPSQSKECYDEKLILVRGVEGFLSMEKCFINGEGQYWYDISGKQALDSYCQINEIGKELLEQLVLQICSQLELLEWNLIEASCLCLHPEVIFLDARKQEFMFLLYPQKEPDIFEELQSLMEYLLTKLDHKDTDAVQIAYEIYEKMLEGLYNIVDLRSLILDRRMKDIEIERPMIEEYEAVERRQEKREDKMNPEAGEWSFDDKLSELYHKTMRILQEKVKEKMPIKIKGREEIPEIIYPQEEISKDTEITIHPTVCLSSMDIGPRGILQYEGIEHYPNFEIGQLACVIGKSHRVKLQIEKETISQFHAKIEWIDGEYYIEDMNSTNGTYVNEEILNYKERKALHSGDILRFADVKYRFL